jgi:hypothetical protein
MDPSELVVFSQLQRFLRRIFALSRDGGLTYSEQSFATMALLRSTASRQRGQRAPTDWHDAATIHTIEASRLRFTNTASLSATETQALVIASENNENAITTTDTTGYIALIQRASTNPQAMKVILPADIQAAAPNYRPKVGLVRDHYPKQAYVYHTERGPVRLGERLHPNLGHARLAFICLATSPHDECDVFCAARPEQTTHVTVSQLYKASLQQYCRHVVAPVAANETTDRDCLVQVLGRLDILPTTSSTNRSGQSRRLVELLEDDESFYVVTLL